MPASPTLEQHNAGYKLSGNFHTVESEHGFTACKAIEGTIPADLKGTLYRNGPGIFERFGESYGHWFGGQGTINAIRFNGGEVQTALKVVHTQEHKQELAKGKAIFADYGRTAPGSWFNKPLKMPKNAANTSVLFWQGRLFALEEGHLATEMDPETLETLPECKFGIDKMGAFSAHPSWVTDLQCGFNFGMAGGKETKLQLFKLPKTGPAEMLAEHDLPTICNLHDFTVTSTHMMFFVSPVRIKKPDMMKVLAGIKPFAKAQSWLPELGMELWIIPLDKPDTKTVIKTRPFFVYHIINAYDIDQGLCIDYIEFPDFATPHDFAYHATEQIDDQPFGGEFKRAIIDLTKETVAFEHFCSEPSEFPIVPPAFQGKASPYLFTAAIGVGGQAPAIKRFQFETRDNQVSEFIEQVDFTFDKGHFCSEPIFVAKPGSKTEGYILSLVYNAIDHKTFIAILDAQDFDRGILAKVYFDQNVPLGFHGRWVNGLV